MRFFYLFLLSILVLSNLNAQTDSYTWPDNTFRTAQNPLYWGNRKPHAGYWQQDVHYRITASLDDKSDIITATQELTYWNNSPDTLTVAYFHLYQNVTTDSSYEHLMSIENAGGDIHKPKPRNPDHLGIVVDEVQHEGAVCATWVDNTLLRVSLTRPILPGTSTTFRLKFRSQAGHSRYAVFHVNEVDENGEMRQVKHYNIVHWYPRIAVYDRHFAWDVQQHFGHEYYGDFGTYDVALTVPNNYVLDGTGLLLNEHEVYPADLRAKLDVRNFKDKPIGDVSKRIIVPDGTTKTFRFHAENVHDCGYTADPTYRLIDTTWNGILCRGMAREENAAGWQDAADFTMKCVRLYSQDIGMYGYPKMIAADANSGMEYPMMTLDGGTSPGYKGLFAHEIGHNWFYGMIGNNETYRAFLDEGFTQFLTAWSMIKLERFNTEAQYQERFWAAYYMYLLFARKGYDGTLHTHSDHYHGQQYGMVYLKTSTMLYNLQYLLGDELFLKSLQHYFGKWKFCHPYPEDYRAAITEYVKTDLTWFFDQWMETSDRIDYAVTCVKNNRDGSAAITFRRKGEMQMPLDFDVITRSGDTLKYTLPNSYFAKTDRTKAGYWYGFENFNRKHTVTIQPSGPVRRVEIDPSHRLADLDLTNNTSGCLLHRTHFTFWRKGFVPLEWRKYEMNLYPSLWWNGQAGAQTGAVLQGVYLQEQNNFSLGLWYNSAQGQTTRTLGKDGTPPTGLPNPYVGYTDDAYADDVHPLSYHLRYSSYFKPLGRLAYWDMRAQLQDGMQLYELGLRKKLSKDFYNLPNYLEIYARARALYRDPQHANYLLYPTWWNTGQVNSTLTLGVRKAYQKGKVTGSNTLELRSAIPGSDVYYTTLNLTARHSFSVLKKLDLHTRLFGQYAEGNLPLESALYLAGASPEAMMDNDLTRARGLVPDALLAQDGGASVAHFQMGGGLNLRGYAGYLAQQEGSTSPAWLGGSGASFSAELDFERLLPIKLKKLGKYVSTEWYAFYDAGVLGYSSPQVGPDGVRWDRLRQDAGLGTAWHIKHASLSRQRRTTTIRLDVPLLLTNPPATDDYVTLRWVLGIGRTF